MTATRIDTATKVAGTDVVTESAATMINSSCEELGMNDTSMIDRVKRRRRGAK